MKEKNNFQLDELGNRIYTRIIQNDDGVSVSANIHFKKVGSEDILFIGNYLFDCKIFYFSERKKVFILESYVAFENFVFTHLPFEIDLVNFKLEAHTYIINKPTLENEMVFPDGIKDNFSCKRHFPCKLLKKQKTWLEK